MGSEEKKKEEFALMRSEDRALALSHETSIFLNVAKFEQMQRAAKMMSMTDFIPQRFVGNVGNCFIAIDLAERMRMHPLMLMQTMYVVHGTPGFEGKFMSALVNNSGRYTDPLEYEWKGKQGSPEWGCRAFAKRKSTDKVVYGPWVDWKMVTAEGWHHPKGSQKSKWTTMPEIMFMYRAASFFVKTNDSDLMMGMQTVEELQDMDADLLMNPAGVYTVGGSAERRPGMYDVTQESKGVTKDAAKTLGGEDPEKETEPAPSNEPAPEPGAQSGDEEGGKGPAQGTDDQSHATEDPGPDAVSLPTDEWKPERWHNAKAPGLKNQAEAHKDTFLDQPVDLREAFQEKWERLDGLKELRFPFNELGVWVGYTKASKPAPSDPPAPDKGPEEETPSSESVAQMERFNEIWTGGNETAKFQACVSMGIPTNKRPAFKDIGTWLVYYDASMKKIQEKESSNDQGGEPDVGDQTPFDDPEKF